MRRKIFLIVCFFTFYNIACAQSSFRINNDKGKFTIDFELVNNLIVVPLEINGLELSFLLDTGVYSTILFSLGDKDTLDLKNTEEIFLRGWGDGELIKALKSTGNQVRLGEAISKNLTTYLVFDNPLGLSNRMGVPVHGIIGYDLFRDFIVEIDYVKKILRFYNPDVYKGRKCTSCDELDLVFHRNKPYVNIEGEINGKTMPLKMLIDISSGDALWLFENDSGIKLPDNYFRDFLGFGIGGSVYGGRSRIEKINLGSFSFHDITASFPDSVYFRINTYDERNGSIRAQVLNRFHLTVDYAQRKIRFKPNKNFDEPFEYDMSGVVIAHDGFTVIKDILRNPIALREEDKNQTLAGNIVYKSTYDVKFSLEPQYRIAEIRPDSPASKAGLLESDILLKINGRPAFKYSLSEITNLLSSENGKRIKLVIERNGMEKIVTFFLERIL